MRVRKNKSEVINNLNSQPEAFGLGDPKKIISIFYDGFYSDPIKSSLRELFQNAYDSQKESGKEKESFKVDLPTIFESVLRVRDFGKGLTHHFMMNQYTIIGFSTKDGADYALGGWGWGRLACLAYVDSYTVKSYQGGVVRTYLVYKDSEGIPDISFIDESNTEKPDGLLVEFPVKEEDHSKFKEAYNELVIGFDVPPNNEKPVEVLIQGDNWFLPKSNKNSSYYGSPPSYVRMGCVAYVLNDAILDIPHLPLGLIIDIPIGSIEVTVSREAINYKPEVISYLRRTMEEVSNNYLEILQNNIDKAKSILEANFIYKAALIASRYNHKLFSRKDIRYEGYKLPLSKSDFQKYTLLSCAYSITRRGSGYALCDSISHYINTNKIKRVYFCNNFSDKAQKIVRDVKVAKRIKDYEGTYDSIVVIKFDSLESRIESKPLIEKFFGPDVSYSEVSTIPKDQTSGNGGTRVYDMTYERWSYNNNYRKKPIYNYNLNDKDVFWLPMKGGYVTSESHDVFSQIELYTKLGYLEGKKVYGVPQNLIKKVEVSAWTKLEKLKPDDPLLLEVAKAIDYKGEPEHLDLPDIKSYFTRRFDHSLIDDEVLVTMLSMVDSVETKKASLYKGIYTSRLSRYLKDHGVVPKKPKVKAKRTYSQTELRNIYPILDVIDPRSLLRSNRSDKILADYINETYKKENT